MGSAEEIPDAMRSIMDTINPHTGNSQRDAEASKDKHAGTVESRSLGRQIISGWRKVSLLIFEPYSDPNQWSG